MLSIINGTVEKMVINDANGAIDGNHNYDSAILLKFKRIGLSIWYEDSIYDYDSIVLSGGITVFDYALSFIITDNISYTNFDYTIPSDLERHIIEKLYEIHDITIEEYNIYWRCRALMIELRSFIKCMSYPTISRRVAESSSVMTWAEEEIERQRIQILPIVARMIDVITASKEKLTKRNAL